MVLFSGYMYDFRTDITYSNKNIIITRDYGNYKDEFSFKDIKASPYLYTILQRLAVSIRDTLKEINSDDVITLCNHIKIDKYDVKGLMEIMSDGIVHIISDILNNYSDYIIKPSLLICGGIKCYMYEKDSTSSIISEFMGVIYKGRKYIIEEIYLIPNSRNNFVKFYFQHYTLLMGSLEILECRNEAIRLGDSIEDNKNEVALFRG